MVKIFSICFAFFFFLPFITFAQPLIGDKVPGFITPSVSGENVALRDFWEKGKNRVVVISFFATHCDLCTKDLLYLQKLQDRYGKYGFKAVCVLSQDPAERDYIRSFTEKKGLRLLVLLDEFEIIGARYGVAILPTHYVIKEGILRGFYLNLHGENRKHFEGLLSEILEIPIGVPIPAPSDLLPPY
jgi:peroxiredoxin